MDRQLKNEIKEHKAHDKTSKPKGNDPVVEKVNEVKPKGVTVSE